MKKHYSEAERKKLVFAYCAIIPVMLIFAFVRIVPILTNFYYSLYNSTIVDPTANFIGMGNFKELSTDPFFITSIKNTFTFAIWVTLFSVVLSLFLAIALERKTRMSAFYEAVYFLPVITPMVPVSVVWKWIYDPAYGLLNYILSFFGISPVGWLVYPKTAMIAIIIMSVWKTVGYNMIILLVGMRDIPQTYHEAASIDGASEKQVFRHITMPLLKPILLYVLVISTINSFNVFSQVYVMTGGGQGASGNSVRTIVFDIYENAFRYFRTGYASAESVIMFLIILALTGIEMFVTSSDEQKEKRRNRRAMRKGGRA